VVGEFIRLTVSSQVITSGLSKSQSAGVALNQASLSLYQGLTGLNAALKQASGSATALASSTAALSQGAKTASTGAASLASGATSLASGAESLSTGTSELRQGLAAALARLGQITAGAQTLAKDDPSLTSSAAYQAMLNNLAAESTLVGSMSQAVEALAEGTALSAQESTKLASGISALNQSLAELSGGTAALASHLGAWSAGVGQLATLSGQLATGAGALHGGIGQLASGTGQLAAGSQALTQGLAQVGTKVASDAGPAAHLLAGLTAASRGTKTVAVDLQHLGTLFLTPLASQSGTGTIISPELLSDPQFQSVINAYVSPRGHVATLTVVLSQNPYSASAMNRLPTLTAAVHRALAGGPYQHAAIYLGGSTSQSVALDHLSNQDFGQTALLVLLVIGVMLLVLLRSVLAPIVLLGLVSLNYFATTRLAAWVAIGWLHQTGLSWTAPFFSFLLLVALGVDYVIFYMARFREEERGSMGVALVRTSRLAGPVVFSAALIMAGTFGSMAASGATDLMEIGITVVIGLGLDLLFVMGITAPAALHLLGPALHWPFRSPVPDRQEATAQG